MNHNDYFLNQKLASLFSQMIIEMRYEFRAESVRTTCLLSQ